MYDRETILDSMARTIFVCAYADHCDECDLGEDCEICGEHGSAGGGQDWMDVAPEGTTPDAMAIAIKMVERFENANNIQLETAYARAAARQNAAPGKSYWRAPTRHEFGHCLAMEAMGHGVSWSDSHPDHGYKVLQVEGLYL